MRIAIVCGSNRDRPAEFFYTLASHLRKRGHEVWLVRWNVRIGESMDVPEGIFEAVFPDMRPNRFRSIRWLYGLLSSKRFDCVLATHVGINAAAVAGLAAGITVRCGWFRTRSTALLYDMGGPSLKSVFLLARRRAIYGALTHIVAVSEACREDLMSFWKVPSKKIVVLQNSIRKAPGELQNLQRDSAKIVCVGRLVAVKGQEFLIQALPAVLKRVSGLQCHLIGDGPERSRLEKLTAELGLAAILFT